MSAGEVAVARAVADLRWIDALARVCALTLWPGSRCRCRRGCVSRRCRGCFSWRRRRCVSRHCRERRSRCGRNTRGRQAVIALAVADWAGNVVAGEVAVARARADRTGSGPARIEAIARVGPDGRLAISAGLVAVARAFADLRQIDNARARVGAGAFDRRDGHFRQIYVIGVLGAGGVGCGK